MWTDSGLYQCAVELTLFVMLIFAPALTKLRMILQRFSCPLSDFASELNLDWAAHIRGPQIDCWVKKRKKVVAAATTTTITTTIIIGI